MLRAMSETELSHYWESYLPEEIVKVVQGPKAPVVIQVLDLAGSDQIMYYSGFESPEKAEEFAVLLRAHFSGITQDWEGPFESQPEEEEDENEHV